MWFDKGFDSLPHIKVPLAECPSTLVNSLVTNLQVHNFGSSLLVVAGAIMTLHYATLQSLGGCPVIVAYGGSETGKSTSLLAALSVLGISIISVRYIIVLLQV